MASEMTNYTNAAGDFASGMVARGTGMLADRIERYVQVADELESSLRDRNEPQAADLAGMISQRTSDVVTYLRDTDGRALLDDLGSAMHGRGWMLAGVGIAGGILLARTVRAASSDSSDGDYVESHSAPRVSTRKKKKNRSKE
jgi:hypothetical protein